MTKLAFSAHRVDRDQLRALGNSVIVTDMVFDERFTKSGIVLLNDNGKSTGIRPRWGQVYAVGPDQKDVTVGQYILVAHGRWTRANEIEIDGEQKSLRRVDHNDILMVSDELPDADDTLTTAVSIDKKG